MFDRVVSYASLMLAIASLVFFGSAVYSLGIGSMSAGNGAMALGGWLLMAMVFGYRWSDPKWLDAVSIVKSR